MPNVHITAPTLSFSDKDTLARHLTEVFTRHTGCGESAVTIWFNEVGPRNCFVGGKSVLDAKNEQIFSLRVDWYPKSGDVQQAVASGLTEAIAATGHKPGLVEVDFHTLLPGDHFEGGKRQPYVKTPLL
jgi:phenylpyruvate tautomerase PptA (4-oxalocrotonate tautomerase family)